MKATKISTEYLLEHDLKAASNGKTPKAVMVRAKFTKKGVSVFPVGGGNFCFEKSDPRLVFLVGELISYAGTLYVNQMQDDFIEQEEAIKGKQIDGSRNTNTQG